MAVSPRLPKHLRDVLGPDAGEELVLILDEMRSQHADLRAEFRREMQALEARLDARFARIDARFDHMDERFTALDRRVADVKSDLMKWSFVFWCGSVTAIALLARVLER